MHEMSTPPPIPHRVHLRRMGWFGVDVSLFLSQLGYCVVYLIFVAQNLGPLLRKVLPSEYRWLAGTLAILMVQVRDEAHVSQRTNRIVS